MRRGGVRAYSANEVTIDGRQLAALGEKVNHWLTKLPPATHEIRCSRLVIKLASNDVAGQDPAATLTLHDIRGRIDRDAAGRLRAQFAATLAPSDQTSAAVIQWTLEPSVDGASAAATLTLDAQAAAVPARSLAAVIPGFGKFGPAARFTGLVRWTLDHPQVQGSATGRLHEVDLAQVLPAGSPHSLGGHATIELTELSWTGERIERLGAAVIAEHARMSRSLLEAAVTTFRCGQGSDGVPAPDEPASIALDLLAVRFQMSSEGLTFWGHCPPEANMQEGCLAVSGLQPLLIARPYYNWPLGALVQTFAAPSSAWLPATREAIEMGSRLPLPLR
jgi:hypothetical protein